MIKHQLKELRKVTTDVDNSVSTKMKKLSQIFDSDYFENGVQSKKSNYKDYSWERLGSYFQRTAQHIVDVFSPQKALDVGCAKGFLVKALQDLGVNAKGIDPSEYALSKAISKGVKLGIAQKIPGKANQYDLVICFDVLEHLPESEVPLACKELLRVAKKNVIVRVPTKVEERDLEKTHETIRPKDWWEHKFVEAGGTVNEISAILDKGTWWFNVPECLIWIEK
jgi:2-polyprenyl-3-methyl-5-hydroxy-6-metoxy-1,4-benzoquinol methylase